MNNNQKTVAVCLGGNVGHLFERFKGLYEQQAPSNIPPRHEVSDGRDQFVEFRSQGWTESRFLPHTLGPITWTYSKQLILEDEKIYSIQVGKIPPQFENHSATERFFITLFDDRGNAVTTVSDTVNGENLIARQQSGGGINLIQSALYAVVGERLPVCWLRIS